MRHLISIGVLWVGSSRAVEVEPVSEQSMRIRSRENAGVLLVAPEVPAAAAAPAAGGIIAGEPPRPRPYRPKTVQEVWANHWAGIGNQSVDMIMLDYDSSSLIRQYDSAADKMSTFQGLAQIKTFFAAILTPSNSASDFKVLNLNIDEDQRQVFFVWEFPGAGIQTGTDTFVIGTDFKIKRQNIVSVPKYKPKSVQEVWANHWEAIGIQSLEKIMLDYDESSLIRQYDSAAGKTSEFRGLAQIKTFFAAIFTPSNSASDFKILNLDIDETPRQVFFVWEFPGAGIKTGTDTFVMGTDFKIKRQNSVASRFA